jgi:hypothetical protein
MERAQYVHSNLDKMRVFNPFAKADSNVVKSRKRRKASLIPHGTVNGYMNYGCRERCCKTAWANYIRERRSRRNREMVA